MLLPHLQLAAGRACVHAENGKGGVAGGHVAGCLRAGRCTTHVRVTRGPRAGWTSGDAERWPGSMYLLRCVCNRT
jgi:hypothetical protein